MYANRLELTDGVLLTKKTHTILLGSLTGVSAVGFGGSVLRIEAGGVTYDVKVGIGAASKIRQRILDNLP